MLLLGLRISGTLGLMPLTRCCLFSIHIVVPRPSQIRMQRATCHILLEQNKPDHRAALVLTASIEGTANDGIMQGAYSMPIAPPAPRCH